MKKNQIVKPKQNRLPIEDLDNSSVERYIDGAARGNPGNSGIGVLIRETKDKNREVKKYLGTKTNNQAEYTALITALESANNLKERQIKIFTDSLLVANQINGIWKVRHPEIITLNKKAKQLLQNFKNITIQHIPRELNSEADRLANLAIDEYL